MDADAAEEVAVAALVFIANDEERLGRFIDLTGIAADRMREAAAQPGFFRGVLQHVVDWQPLLLEFAAAEGMAPEDVVAAATALGAIGQG